jgi:hypothetical protein
VANLLRPIPGAKIEAVMHDVQHELPHRGLAMDCFNGLWIALQPEIARYKDLIVFNCSLNLPSRLSAIKIPSSITSENESGGALDRLSETAFWER